MKKAFIFVAFLFMATVSWAQTWNAALIEDRFGQATRDTVFYQLVSGVSYVGGRQSQQLVGVGYYPEGNTYSANTVAFYLNGYNFSPWFFRETRTRVALSVKDVDDEVRVFGGWQKIDASGISIIMDKNSGLLKLLEKPFNYLAVLDGPGWSARFAFTGGLPRRR